MTMTEQTASGFKAGFVSLIGRTNVGKSTLLNQLLGTKVSIVAPKPQTTRTRIQGVVNRSHGQVVLVDTPGFHLASKNMGRALSRAMRGVADAEVHQNDVVLWITQIHGDTPRLDATEQAVLRALKNSSCKVVLAINKIDKVRPKENLLPWIDFLTQQIPVAAVVPISALTGDGTERLIDALLALLPEGPALFSEDIFTDQLERQITSELIREQILLQVHQEVPHGTAVVIEKFADERDTDKPLCSIEGRIVVERDTHKAILVGKQGARIKSLSLKARLEIEKLLGAKVYLRMHVVVDPRWTHDGHSVKSYGIGE